MYKYVNVTSKTIQPYYNSLARTALTVHVDGDEFAFAWAHAIIGLT